MSEENKKVNLSDIIEDEKQFLKALGEGNFTIPLDANIYEVVYVFFRNMYIKRKNSLNFFKKIFSYSSFCNEYDRITNGIIYSVDCEYISEWEIGNKEILKTIVTELLRSSKYKANSIMRSAGVNLEKCLKNIETFVKKIEKEEKKKALDSITVIAQLMGAMESAFGAFDPGFDSGNVNGIDSFMRLAGKKLADVDFGNISDDSKLIFETIKNRIFKMMLQLHENIKISNDKTKDITIRAQAESDAKKLYSNIKGKIEELGKDLKSLNEISSSATSTEEINDLIQEMYKKYVNCTQKK